MTLAAVMLAVSAPPAAAQGGCGSVCLPLEALDPEQAQLEAKQVRVTLTSQSGRFDNFREGGDDITNPGGNEAVIQDL